MRCASRFVDLYARDLVDESPAWQEPSPARRKKLVFGSPMEVRVNVAQIWRRHSDCSAMFANDGSIEVTFGDDEEARISWSIRSAHPSFLSPALQPAPLPTVEDQEDWRPQCVHPSLRRYARNERGRLVPTV